MPVSLYFRKSQSVVSLHNVLHCEEFMERILLVFTWDILSLSLESEILEMNLSESARNYWESLDLDPLW